MSGDGPGALEAGMSGIRCLTDTQLLGHFVAEHDEAAFRTLVVRHGPMVLKVCRRVLDDPHEAEDAFQATFLVLVRKAPTIRDPEALGNWLYGVAYRVAMRSRRGIARRRRYEGRRAEMQPADRTTDPPGDDLGRTVREELGHLPDLYRAPLELCYLRGRSHEEAADELGWPLGTLKTRLVRGRRRLRDRLARRGVALGLGLMFWLRPRWAHAVPESLVESTVEAMLRDRQGGLAAPDLRFERASHLARDFQESGGGPNWLGPLLVLLLALLGATWGVDAYGRARAAAAEEFAALPANLTDVLRVECR